MTDQHDAHTLPLHGRVAGVVTQFQDAERTGHVLPIPGTREARVPAAPAPADIYPGGRVWDHAASASPVSPPGTFLQRPVLFLLNGLIALMGGGPKA